MNLNTISLPCLGRQGQQTRYKSGFDFVIKNLTNQVNKLVTKMVFVFVFVQHPLQNGMNKQQQQHGFLLFCLKLRIG